MALPVLFDVGSEPESFGPVGVGGSLIATFTLGVALGDPAGSAVDGGGGSLTATATAALAVGAPLAVEVGAALVRATSLP